MYAEGTRGRSIEFSASKLNNFQVTQHLSKPEALIVGVWILNTIICILRDSTHMDVAHFHGLDTWAGMGL
jgi:hypothetical protein